MAALAITQAVKKWPMAWLRWPTARGPTFHLSTASTIDKGWTKRSKPFSEERHKRLEEGRFPTQKISPLRQEGVERQMAMALKIRRCPENPIVWPGKYAWRMSNAYNPGVIYDEGRFWMYERASGSLRPHQCQIGLLCSEDGVHFEHVLDQPVFTPEMAGNARGSVQDPRVVKIEDTFYMTYAFRRYAWNISPTGLGVPDAAQADFPGFDPATDKNQTRSGIAVSKDRIHWEHLCWATPADIDDRDVILFPERIRGRYALLRRPIVFVDTSTAHGEAQPCIRISFSSDLQTWTEPEVVARPEFAWEDNRIGGSTPPVRTEAGWLVLYHGVQNVHPPTRRVIYRLGAMLVDLEDPTKLIARAPNFIMEPEAYYERFGLFIPNVIFPTANVVRDGLLCIYYGVCDTAIALATVPLDALVRHILDS